MGWAGGPEAEEPRGTPDDVGDALLGRGPAEAPQPLTEGALAWLPYGAPRSITAGEDGLTYVTVHRRRPGMRIGPRPGS
ncbi:hypothetical protein ACVB8X_18295 [Streptomyces sp. NRAIS4]